VFDEIPDRVSDIAAAVADGCPLDWDALESSAPDGHERTAIHRLRAIARLGMELSLISLGGTAETCRLAPDDLGGIAPPATWGTLRILGKVGSGRFGDVYRAWDPALDREVALKILRHSNSETLETQVIEEGRLMARIRHPNVVTIHGAQRIAVDGRAVTGLWMEFITGPTLAAELAERDRFDPDELTRIGIELCGALAAVHHAGLVHRDVKAQNVMRDERGRIMLGDFGTGRELDDPEPTRGALAGTPAYVAPELFAGQPASPESDLYSLGVLLFHLATSLYPVSGRSLRQLREAHEQGARTPLASLRTDLPTRLTRAIEQAIDPEPGKRFSSAEAMATALEQCLPKKRARRLRMAVATTFLLLASVSAATWHARRATEPSLPFAARDWVLITDFENRTQEPHWDGRLEYAIQRELANSSFVNVVSRLRMDETLKLMRKQPGVRVDEAIGREIALRDGGVRALVAGRVEKIGNAYSISAQILDPGDGAIFGSIGDTAVARSDLAGAIDRVAVELRDRLRRVLPSIERQQMPLPRVATSSLRALTLYSQARALTGDGPILGGDPHAVESLLLEALDQDPDFVWARIVLGQRLRSQQGRMTDAIAHFERAVGAADSGSPDWHLARANVGAVRADVAETPADRRLHLDHAMANLRTLLELQPDHIWAMKTLLTLAPRTRRFPSADFIRRFVELRPDDPSILSFASASALAAGFHADAREYASRGRRLLDTVPGASKAPGANWLRLAAAQHAFRERSAAQALAEVDAVLEDVRLQKDRAGGPEAVGYGTLHLSLALGRPDRAEQMAGFMIEEATRGRFFIVAAGERGDRRAVRDRARRLLATSGELTGGSGVLAAEVVTALLDAGMYSEVRRALEDTKRAPRSGDPLRADLLGGLLANAEGRLEEAVVLLDRYIQAPRPFFSLTILSASLGLADALVAGGQITRAVAVLERAVRDAEDDGHLYSSQLMHVRDRLAVLYRQLGRVTEAQEIESDLRALLAVADDDHPIKRRLVER
jgi:tetratricopeptide (TPR) repeat protein